MDIYATLEQRNVRTPIQADRETVTEQRLPVKVQLWTGEEYSPPAPVKTAVALRNSRALLALAKPTLGSLARSYVEQEIDLAGDTRSIIELGASFCRP